MRQQTLADEGFERYRKPTRREQFLDEMDKIVPWEGLCEVIEPFYPKPEGAGRPPIGLERMLRIHFLQHWFNLSDPAVEEALYDSRAMRRFVGIDLGREPAPDETTVCKFRHLLEAHNLGDPLFALIAEYLLKVQAGRRSAWNACSGFIFCSTGSTCPTRRWKKRCMTRAPCAVSSVLIWAVSRPRTRPRYASSAIFWRHTTWATNCLY